MSHKLVLDENMLSGSYITFLCSECGARFVFNKTYLEKVCMVKFDDPDTISILKLAAAMAGDPCQPNAQ